jgi:diaminopimelate epimerase
VNLTKDTIEYLCDRRFGIGADGLMMIEPSAVADFKMTYYNSDGLESTLCGNGSRCIVKYAFEKNIVEKNCRFESIVGVHFGQILSNQVEISMIDVPAILKLDENTFELNTGSPHYVSFQNDIQKVPLIDFAKKIRYSEAYPQGINVNLVEIVDETKGELSVRTYERGVEDETYSCGTGITAASLCFMALHPLCNQVRVLSKGGVFEVGAIHVDGQFKNVWLRGDAQKVFEGEIEVS